ncbi:MAG: amidinotransferase [Chloroflexia bacterium]|nr:amidinotransferase [Chloroflexia bacterium]
MRTYGAQNMVSQLRKVMLRTPDAAFYHADPLRWHYTTRPNQSEALAEHAALCDTLRKAGVEVIMHDAPLADHADAIFCFDPAIVTDYGAILLQMGKSLRVGEEAAIGASMQKNGIPILGTLNGDARAEGGDMIWLDNQTLAVGLGFRTNAAAVSQLKAMLEPKGVTVLAYDLPYYTGPEACLHLLSFISMVDHDMAVVHLPLMPTGFYQELKRRNMKLIEIPASEYDSMATNVLAIAPKVCLMLDCNPITARLLADAGCEVQTYRGNEISLKAEGGPTCLTRPLLRD